MASRTRSLRPHAATALVGVALLSAACTSSKSSSAGSGASNTPTTSAASAILGPSKPATGTPIKIGFITDGKSTAIDNSSEVPAAQAAAKYINEHLGGVDGHPITLDTCSDQQTPAGATDCANQMITDKVPVVLQGVSGQGGTIMKAVTGAGIPYMIAGALDQSTLTTKTSYVLTNGLATGLAGPAKVAQDSGAKRAAVVVTDVPAATGPIKAIDPVFYKNAGVALDILTVPPGTPDMSPQIQSEMGKNPDQFAIVGDAAFCTSAIKAMKSAGFSKTIVLIPQCIGTSSGQSIPGGYAGMKLITASSTSPTDPEVQLYNAVMATYAPGTPPNGDVTSGGYSVVLGFARGMTALSGDITPDTVNTTLTAMSPEALPLATGVTFQCNGKQVTITPSICSTSALVTTLDQAGQPTGGYQPIDTSALLKLG
ncbi:MAG: ABC transporter substrate-binding protein [Acidimicrobiales bacterium]